MEIEFDFKKEESKVFGYILRPVARIILSNQKRKIIRSPQPNRL